MEGSWWRTRLANIFEECSLVGAVFGKSIDAVNVIENQTAAQALQLSPEYQLARVECKS